MVQVTIQVTNPLSKPAKLGKSGQRNLYIAGDFDFASVIPKLDVEGSSPFARSH
jgi:hypothetical protein